MLKSRLRNYSDTYILVKGKMINIGEGNDASAGKVDERDKSVAFKNCLPFTNCIIEINSTQIDNCKDIDIVKPVYNLLEYSDNCAKTSGSLCKYYRVEPNDNIAYSASVKFKIKIT